MSAYPYLPLFTQDFIANTTHLSAQETGAYVMLLMVAWQSPDCRLPDNDRKLATWARVDPETWREIKAEVMAFWTLTDGWWHQKRLTKERQHVAQVSEKRRAAIRKRWDTNELQMKKNCNSNGIHPYPYPREEEDLREDVSIKHAATYSVSRGGGKKVSNADISANPVGEHWGDDE